MAKQLERKNRCKARDMERRAARKNKRIARDVFGGMA